MIERVPRRTGLSLVEVLVVLGIISLLLALLIPAIQGARAAARKTECINHLRQMGMAMHNYHEQHSMFPPGYSPWSVKRGDDGDEPMRWDWSIPGYAWSAHLLPLLDQSALYNSLDLNHRSLAEAAQDPATGYLLSTPLAIFRCPDDLADETMETAPLRGIIRSSFKGRTVQGEPLNIYGGSSSYVGSCGYFSAYHPFGETGYYLADKDEMTADNNGIFYPASSVSLGDITDGSSNTIAIGERAWFQGSSTWVGATNIRSHLHHGAATCLGQVYWRINEIPDPPGQLMTFENGLLTFDGWSARGGFSSYHEGGALFAMADGSVRFLSENIDFRNTTPSHPLNPIDPIPNKELLGTFQKLGIRNDNQVVTDF